MVSEKQKSILLKNGYTEQAILNMSYEDISAKIGEILQNKDKPSTQAKKVSQNGLNVQKLLLPPNSAVVIHRNERANSYEFGKAGNRFKIYFEDAKDLHRQVREIEESGLMVERPGEE